MSVVLTGVSMLARSTLGGVVLERFPRPGSGLKAPKRLRSWGGDLF